MSYPAMQVANAFIKKQEEGKLQDLTPMKLQKLMFFAQSWYVKQRGTLLIDDNFERWNYGPVIPSVYYEFKVFGGQEIEDYAKDSKGEPYSTDLDPSDEYFLDQIIATYGSYTGGQLSYMTHQEGTAWSYGCLGTPITIHELYRGDV